MTEGPHETRLDLAREQLDVAIGLFLDKQSYVSALTLAGAAEEIMGRALTLSGKANVIDYWHDSISEVWGVSRKEFLTKTNDARNAAKHLASTEDMSFTFDPMIEAVWLIVRACDNHRRLEFADTDQMSAFNEWFHGEFIGV